MTQNLLHLANEARIPGAGVLVTRRPERLDFSTPSVSAYHRIGKFVASKSERTVMTFLALPPLPTRFDDGASVELWMNAVNALLSSLPPTALCRKGEPMDILSFAI